MFPISKSFFSIAPLNESAYELTIQFSADNDSIVSERKFTFLQPVVPFDGEVFDVLTKNGTSTPTPLKGLFSGKDVQEARRAAAKLLGVSLPSPSLFVLDLKDPHTGYLPCGECSSIAESEAAVCQLFQESAVDLTASKSVKKLHALFQTKLPVDFMLCEGTLKMDLLKQGGFSDQEVEYFHTTSAGAMGLCQFAEFFMNGFKLGQVVPCLPDQGKYFLPISDPHCVFKPQKKSTVYYPPLYQTMYSLEGGFAKILDPLFSLTGGFDPAHKITVLSVEWKG